MTKKLEKPNCYDCKHRQNIPGDCHSSCQHPGAAKAIEDNPLLQALAIFTRIGDAPPAPPKSTVKINVKANPHGVRSGWFTWPVNFDPNWLEACDGFEKE